MGLGIERIARDAANRIVNGLDDARRASSPQNPLHEVDLITAGIIDAIETALAEIQPEDERKTG